MPWFSNVSLLKPFAHPLMLYQCLILSKISHIRAQPKNSKFQTQETKSPCNYKHSIVVILTKNFELPSRMHPYESNKKSKYTFVQL